MKNLTTTLLLALSFAGIDAVEQDIQPTHPTKVATVDQRGYLAENSPIRKLRAAKLIVDLKLEGLSHGKNDRGEYVNWTPRNYIQFYPDHNFLAMSIRGDYRQGRIQKIKAGQADSKSGHYILETWKQQNYAGFDSGPDKAYFETYELKWDVVEIKDVTPKYSRYLLEKVTVEVSLKRVGSGIYKRVVHKYTFSGTRKTKR